MMRQCTYLRDKTLIRKAGYTHIWNNCLCWVYYTLDNGSFRREGLRKSGRCPDLIHKTDGQPMDMSMM